MVHRQFLVLLQDEEEDMWNVVFFYCGRMAERFLNTGNVSVRQIGSTC
jgi:hypothetical protein